MRRMIVAISLGVGFLTAGCQPAPRQGAHGSAAQGDRADVSAASSAAQPAGAEQHGGDRPAPGTRQRPKGRSAESPAAEKAAIVPSVSAEQVKAARQLAEDLGVLIKTDADGNVILIDTAANRSWVDDAQMEEMLVFPTLVSLTVEGPNISHELASHIAGLPALKFLAMRNTMITNLGIAELRALKSLTAIDLRLSPLVNDDGIESLATMDALRAVRLSGVNVTDKGVDALLRLPRLTELDLRNCRGVTKAGFERLAGKGSLRMLKIGGARIDDDVLAVIAGMKSLTGLSLDNCNITDSGVAKLAVLSLIDLTIYQCPNVSDKGLEILASFKDLRRLTLRDVAAGGAALTALPHPEKLASLNMAQSGITDGDVVHLERLTGLASLVLNETALTDAAVDTLSKLTSLKKLEMTQTKVTEQGFARLAEAIPGCSIRSN